MMLLSILDQLPVSDTTLAIVAGSISAFFGGFFAILRLRMTKPERDADAAKTTASAMEIMANQVIESNKQVLESNRQTVLTNQTMLTMMERQDAEREMYRKRQTEQEERHNTQIKALEKSLIESQEELKDTREQVMNLQNLVDGLKRDNEQQHRDATRKATEDAAIIAAQEKEIAHLRIRVTELEQELAQVKAQQQQPTTIATAMKPEPIPELKELVDSLTEMKAEPVSPQPGEHAMPAPGSESVGQ